LRSSLKGPKPLRIIEFEDLSSSNALLAQW